MVKVCPDPGRVNSNGVTGLTRVYPPESFTEGSRADRVSLALPSAASVFISDAWSIVLFSRAMRTASSTVNGIRSCAEAAMTHDIEIQMVTTNLMDLLLNNVFPVSRAIGTPPLQQKPTLNGAGQFRTECS